MTEDQTDKYPQAYHKENPCAHFIGDERVTYPVLLEFAKQNAEIMKLQRDAIYKNIEIARLKHAVMQYEDARDMRRLSTQLKAKPTDTSETKAIANVFKHRGSGVPTDNVK